MSQSGNPGGSRSTGGTLRPLSICRNSLALTRAQTAALIRLIHAQIDAYEEAVSGGKNRGPSAPFTAADLDAIEPLLAELEKLAL